MKFTSSILLPWFASNRLGGVHADGELIASWVQFTGANMQNAECAKLVKNSGSSNSLNSKAAKYNPGCFFTAEVRAIYNDTAMANPGCPDNVLKINGEDTPMSIRVEAVEYFENFVSKSMGISRYEQSFFSLCPLTYDHANDRCATQFCLLKTTLLIASSFKVTIFPSRNGILTKLL
jgi:hypothetical protein